MKKLLLTLLAGSCITGHASYVDGNYLHERIRRGADTNVMLYIAGVADTVSGVLFCPPANVPLGQLYDMFRAYLENNPSIRHLPGDVLITNLLQTQWPCRRGRSGT